MKAEWLQVVFAWFYLICGVSLVVAIVGGILATKETAERVRE